MSQFSPGSLYSPLAFVSLHAGRLTYLCSNCPLIKLCSQEFKENRLARNPYNLQVNKIKCLYTGIPLCLYTNWKPEYFQNDKTLNAEENVPWALLLRPAWHGTEKNKHNKKTRVKPSWLCFRVNNIWIQAVVLLFARLFSRHKHKMKFSAMIFKTYTMARIFISSQLLLLTPEQHEKY